MIDATPDGVVLGVRVIPRTGRAGIAGTCGGVVLVRLGAAPVVGAANAELVSTLAAAFGVSRRHVTIVFGHSARHKRVRITGIDAAPAAALAPAAETRG